MSEQFLRENTIIFWGLVTTLERTRDFTQSAYDKILEAQKSYYRKVSGGDFSEEQELVIATLDAALHKFYWGTLSLEQMWGVHNHLKYSNEILPGFEDVPITTGQTELVFLFGYLFDQALYTWRSFLDFYLKYLLLFLTGKYEVNISLGTFKKGMENYLTEHEDERSAMVENYIRTKVFSKAYGLDYESWGDFLRELRDKTTHQKLIQPSLHKDERISWPNIRDTDIAEIAQWQFGNKAFDLLRELFPVLYGFEWVPGPYKPGMYNR